VNSKNRKALAAIFAKPTSASFVFSEFEALVKAYGGTVTEREGSRVKISLLGEQMHCHRPHPGKEAKRYQVEEMRALLERVGIKP
jgi:HicA toxin of bacterial toxin-antitoxin,